MKLCLFHDWTKWSMPINTGHIGYKQQWKTCKICNKMKLRTLNYDKGASLTDVLIVITKTMEDSK